MLFCERSPARSPEADRREFLRQLIASNHFHGLGAVESAVYGEVLSYRVQRDYYDILEEKTSDPVTWDQFVWTMQRFPGWI